MKDADGFFMLGEIELDEGHDDLYRRGANGRAAIEAHPSFEKGDSESIYFTAKDLLSDILTALYGPAGSWTTPTEPPFVGHVRRDNEAVNEARRTIEKSMESWLGDAEDYTRADA